MNRELDFEELAEKMYDGSYFTLVGCDLKVDGIKKWVTYMNNLLVSEGLTAVPRSKWVKFKGKDMNDLYELTGDNRYNDDLNFLAFPLDNFKTEEDITKISTIKLIIGARWFDDIVCNDLAREGRA